MTHEIKQKKPKYDHLEILGAREHNLKNIDINIPRNQLVVITGLSGSGKSSLAFDTIYAEGQRRYIETFASYARSFIGDLERPDVDKINGLSPVIAIEQKTTSKNPRSTVGTATEIYDYLRLLFAKIADAYSYASGHKMVKQTAQQIEEHLLATFNEKKITLLAPIVKGRKGHYRELFQQIRKAGFLRARIDGKIKELNAKTEVDRYKIHHIEIVIDRLIVNQNEKQRLRDSLHIALKNGKDVAMVLDENDQIHYFSKAFMDPITGISYDEPAPNSFSFNSPHGACPDCEGLGVISSIDPEAIIPDKTLTILEGAVVPLGKLDKESDAFPFISGLYSLFDADLKTPLEKLPPALLEALLYGHNQVPIQDELSAGKSKKKNPNCFVTFIGIIPHLQAQQNRGNATAEHLKETYNQLTTCPTCEGTRLNKISLSFKLVDQNIAQLCMMNMQQLYDFFDTLPNKLSARQLMIADELIKEIKKRVQFLLNVGLYYLFLHRPLKSLSGGEAQRIRLATQIGTQLVGVLYILDEPSIGLHQRDNIRLIRALQDLRDLGNSVLVVEHDKDMMLQSDYIIDIGPGAGRNGGKVVAAGIPKHFLSQQSITAAYLSGKEKINLPAIRRPGNGKLLSIQGCRGHNLKNVNLNIPLGKFVCLTGVSGSGKSTLIHQTLYPLLKKYLYKSYAKPLEYDTVVGLENLDKVVEVDQKPIGRTPRSNPATYTGVFTHIRNFFSMLPEAKIRGYQPGRFSFNVVGGRCEKCQGGGMCVIEMNFLPDVNVPCQTCRGRRYNRETLEVKYKGKSIADVLDMTVSNAVEFFEKHPSILKIIKILQDVGLGYITLGQQATTLSGGEAQRVKLATELAKRDTGHTLYILDEPTTGLHFQDIQHLLNVLNKLADKGNTVLVIEHNLDIIKVADHIIDIGPEGGDQGGAIVASGTPEEIAQCQASQTGHFLKMELA